MRLEGFAVRLTIFVGEDDQWHHKPLFTEIVHRAHKAGLAGASVIRGIEGYGASSRIHTTRLLSLSEDLPIAVIIVDAEERVRAFLPQLDELVTEGLVIIDPVEVIRYVGRKDACCWFYSSRSAPPSAHRCATWSTGPCRPATTRCSRGAPSPFTRPAHFSSAGSPSPACTLRRR